MKKIQSIIRLGVLVLGTMTLSMARADQPSPAENLRGLLPSQAVILSQTTYNLRGNGQEDNLVYYRAGKTYGMAVISPEKRVVFQFERNHTDHLYFQGKDKPGIVSLDPASGRPFIAFNNYSDSIHSEYHAFEWTGSSFREVPHPEWGNNPQVTLVDGQSVVVTDNFAVGTPDIYQYRQGEMVQVNADFPFFYNPYVKAAWKSLNDPVLGALKGSMGVQVQFLPAFQYAGKAAEGKKFADRLLQGAPSEQTAQVLSSIHTYKGNLLMVMGHEEEGFAEYHAADSCDSTGAASRDAGTFLREAGYFESKGESQRAALAYENVLSRMGSVNRAQVQPLQVKVDSLLGKIEGGSVQAKAGDAEIDLGKPMTVSSARTLGSR